MRQGMYCCKYYCYRNFTPIHTSKAIPSELERAQPLPPRPSLPHAVLPKFETSPMRSSAATLLGRPGLGACAALLLLLQILPTRQHRTAVVNSSTHATTKLLLYPNRTLKTLQLFPTTCFCEQPGRINYRTARIAVLAHGGIQACAIIKNSMVTNKQDIFLSLSPPCRDVIANPEVFLHKLREGGTF